MVKTRVILDHNVAKMDTFGMKRRYYDDLGAWYASKHRKPLLLRGARQVGKSTLVRNFASLQNLDLVEINLEKTSLTSPKKSLELEKIIPEIEFLTRKKIGPQSLLFIDEIQEEPKLITGLRFFKEERPEIPVIAAGSLLEFALSENEISFPVGRISSGYISPICFTEFLMGLGEDRLLKYLGEPLKIPAFAHEALLERYRQFLFVGGMPEAGQVFIETKDYRQVREIQRSIIGTYRDDFQKYSTRSELSRVKMVFDTLPRICGKKVKYSEINPDEKSRDLKRAIELLKFSRVVQPAIHSNGTGTPLSAYEDDSIYKLYFVDVGLLGAMLNTQWADISKKDFSYRGFLAEQFVAQHLSYNSEFSRPPELFYWLKDKKSNKAEVDFLTTLDDQVIPVEVKAGAGGQKKSLIVYMATHKKSMLAVHFSETPFSVQEFQHSIQLGSEHVKSHGHLVRLPFYLIDNFLQVINELNI